MMDTLRSDCIVTCQGCVLNPIVRYGTWSRLRKGTGKITLKKSVQSRQTKEHQMVNLLVHLTIANLMD